MHSVSTSSPEEANIRQLIANGKSKTALDRAKDLHKSAASAASEALLIDAYAARIQSLLDQNLTLEAKSLLDLVRDRYPAAKARLDALKATSAARTGALDELLEPLADPALGAEARAAIEQAVQNTLVDLAALAACSVLPQSHDLRVAAAALDQAFAAVTSGPVTDEEIALPEVSRRSPLGPWKLLVRAIAHFYRGEDDACRECLEAVKPESAPARLIPAMQSMLGAEPAKPPAPAGVALIGRTTENVAALRRKLEELDQAFHEGADDNYIFKLVRSAVQECRLRAPERLETLKRFVWVRGAGGDLDSERMIAALQGLPRQDAAFHRALAHHMEMLGDPESLGLACESWDDFRKQAVRERWFGAKGVEAATLYIHMARLLQKIPPDMLPEMQRERSSRQTRDQEPYFLFPQKLYERACLLDPHPDHFSKWLAWADGESQKQGEDVAKAWHKIRPADIEPLLYLLREAEKRRAYPSALAYLDKAESIDAVHSHVRAARLRLLAGSAIRHLEKRKPHLAAEELKEMADLPQIRQGDRPAFLAALGYVIGVSGGDDAMKANAQAEATRLLGDSLTAGLLALGVAAATKRTGVALPPLQTLNDAQLLAIPASMARVVAIAKDFGVLEFKLPLEYAEEAERQFPKVRGSLDTGQLRTLAEAAMAGGNRQFAYVVSGEGLSRGGSTEGRFLLLRARSLPAWDGNRHSVCAAGAAVLARQHHDAELIGQAVDMVRAVFGPDAFSLTLAQAEEVVRQEIAASQYPTEKLRGPDYSSMLPDEPCDCPECRRKRGEMPDPFGGDDDFNEKKMREMFDKRAPSGMTPEVADMMFELMKEAYLNDIPAEVILDQLDRMDRGSRGSSGGPRKKGKRK